MEIESLKSKWGNIDSFENKSGYKALRISSECISELFIAIDTDGYRCLLLFLPKNLDLKIKGSDKDKLLLSYLSQDEIILIKLKDSNFIDLFNDLIISLYAKISAINDIKDSSQELIYTFYKWSDFFDDSYKLKLSIEQVKGLFGELFHLRGLLDSSKASEVNPVLESWRGPYNTSNDFVFDSHNIEVKTKVESRNNVRISSEFQLEKESNKGLELLVITVRIDLVHGKSLNMLILDIVEIIRKNIGDLSVFYRALGQIGLSVENSKDYNNHKFSMVRTVSFDTTKVGFPKLSKSELPEEITGLSYNLNVLNLNGFIIQEMRY
ncbi:MAG: hypothetical protein ACJASM_001272 [Salibacteraceae bacterium]|jgi:hypothetical protein